MNLYGNTEAKFVREWPAGESPMHSSMASQSRCDGADPMLGREQATFKTIFNALSDAAVFTRIHGEIWLVKHAFTTLFGSFWRSGVRHHPPGIPHHMLRFYEILWGLSRRS
jgi:hypothetical protein